MPQMFEWDEDKAKANQRKHRISFAEPATVFHDLLVASMLDPIHSDVEQRFIAMGRSSQGRLLVVVYAERGDNIRIISCRRATSTERKAYEE
jgi:uncharacterized DUF497 family protein